MNEPLYLTTDELHNGLSEIERSPNDRGIVRAIVVRPACDLRTLLGECRVSPKGGVHGDNWADGCWMSLPDGQPHPDVQIAIMNARAIALIAQSEDRWSLAGDNFYIDLNLSEENLPAGQRLTVGSSVIEITDVPHDACGKFAHRYGSDAVRFVNSQTGKRLHLRGIYAKVVTAGTIRVGDVVSKLSGTAVAQ